MLLSNFTFNLSISHSELFQSWVRQEIHQHLTTNPLVSEVKSYRLLTEVNSDGHTFAVQLFFTTHEDYLSYELNFRDGFLLKLDNLFSGHYAFFHTLLETL